MNFLAHIYLSGDNELLKIGNFMADTVRGKRYLDYSNEIQKGILLHRFIDTYTDAHPIYRQSRRRLYEKYGHYAGVIMDIVYDHFLAKNWKYYNEIELDVYAAQFYDSLKENYELLTIKTQNLMPYMIQQNWLVQYVSLEGLETILFQMDHRTKNRVHMQEAIVEVQEYYPELELEFTQFMKELIEQCQIKLIELDGFL
ncbi:ACP phosphodiesterase [Flavobacterium sp.]|uniref:acyl carrier protein phosphodiesterase n=1 Tax=Flavobacterium sp. TaxID=239 RepID=UPI0038CF6080